jgi:hypothetical protein
MIQYYINNRPVPRAIARHHLAQARPHIDLKMINLMLTWAKTDSKAAAHCAEFGVSVHTI